MTELRKESARFLDEEEFARFWDEEERFWAKMVKEAMESPDDTDEVTYPDFDDEDEIIID